MEPDTYKVELLHYLNPHLIWVLVVEEGEEKNVHLEQIGIYGISPLNVKFDVDGNIKTKKCAEWLPAVSLAMQNIFFEASEVWFSVAFLDHTTSIFDDNLHKYGNLIIKKKDGTTVSMLQSLLKTGFAMEDVQFFHQYLNTQLDYVNTVGVVNKIKQSLKLLDTPAKNLDSILQKQISVFLKTMDLEERGCARYLSLGIRENLLHKQINDLNACKDVDEESAGRACRKSASSCLSGGLLKTINIKNSQINLDPAQMTQGKVDEKHEDFAVSAEIKHENINVKVEALSVEDKNESTDQKSEKTHLNTISMVRHTKGKKVKNKETDSNKKLIAFGPPGINPTQFRMQELETIKVDTPVAKETYQIRDEEPDYYLLNKCSEDHEVDELNILKGINEKCKNINVVSCSFGSTNSEENLVQHHTSTDNTEKHQSASTCKKLNFLKQKLAKMNESSSTADSTFTQGDDSDSESFSALVAKLDLSNGSIKREVKEPEIVFNQVDNNVNPFKNLDGSKSIFVDKLITPTLMVHTKHGNCIQPTSNLRDIPFGTDIHVGLTNIFKVKKPMRLQTVSWPMILRGHSLFIVSPPNSGKTLGYIPAICRLVKDAKNSVENLSIARLTCIIVCATSMSVSLVEKACKAFLQDAQIYACYTSMTDVTITTNILNGCDILISTPTLLVRLIRENLGLDLRSLNTFVIDDCERISEVYPNELKFCLSKVKEMLKTRANKEAKVQYVVASRIWSNFMSYLAKKAPDSVVCIGAFQECVLYSESDTSFQFVEKEKKIDAVLKFLEGIDKSKKTVIACRSDDEVHLLEKTLTNLNHVVYACDSTMTVQELYATDLGLSEYQEPLKGPILVCCDSNLTQLNLTDAHYLIHFSLPELYSMFSRRFAVLIDNYSSLFNNQKSCIKIKIFLENNNVEQLPKILHFIKRCSDNVPAVLDKISATVMVEKDLQKAKAFVPLCSAMLQFGECSDIWYCKERHTIFQEFDKPACWMPTEGTITFKILHYHTPVYYSARMMSTTTNSGVTKYPMRYSMVSIMLGMYYSKEANKKLHGVAKPGDICAVSLKQNQFVRCQVIKILNYTSNNVPDQMVINLLDEGRYVIAHDTSLYYLPEDIRNIESHVIKVILSNIAPQDKDITYSELAEKHLMDITENNDELYMRGQISLAIGNCIFVETLEACQDLTALNKTVVKNNIRNELLNGHAVINPNHLSSLEKLCEHLEFRPKKIPMEKIPKIPTEPISNRVLPKARWAHLECDGHTPVYYLYAKNPSLFFVQHAKFQNCLKILLSDIKKYVAENSTPVVDIKEGDIVIAEFPDDPSYERARIDSIIDSENAKCFFVDLGDWGTVSVSKILPISEKLITQLPFQAIECRLVGIKPFGEQWPDICTSWLVDQFYDSGNNMRYLFAKRFTTEKANFTEGDKYGITLIDTYNDDVCINKLMVNSNLADVNEEVEYLNKDVKSTSKTYSDDNDSTKAVCVENEIKPLNTSPESERESTPTSLISFISNGLSTSASSSSNNSLTEENSFMPSNDTQPTEETVSKSNNIEPNDINQLALSQFHDAKNIDKESSSELSSTIADIRKNQQTIMNLFRTPLRSVPLVNSDDSDDERWDSSNPVQMLMAPKLDTSNVTKPAKIIPALSDNLKSDVHIDIEPDHTTTQPNIEIEASTQNRVDKPSNGTVILDINTDQLVCTESLNTDGTVTEWSISESTQTLVLCDDSSTKIEINWSQDISTVTLKIQMKVEQYDVLLKDKEIQFLAKVNECWYGFEFALYGAVNVNNSIHTNKDTYVEIHMNKIMNKNWLKLHKGNVKKFVKLDDKRLTPTVVVDNKKNEGDLRKPKIVWHQNKNRVTMKILLITTTYDLSLTDKHIKFYAQANDEEYGFDFELNGIVNTNKSSHSNKGQYVQVNLQKVIGSNWRILAKGYIKNWIVYDVDNIDVTSEEEQDSAENIVNFSKSLNLHHESDSEDDFEDDVNFGYKK